MHREDAWDIISRHSLVGRKASKEFLSQIAENKPQIDPIFENLLTQDEFERLKRHYAEKLAELNNSDKNGMPRNLPFYLMVKDILPDFSWEVQTDSTGENQRCLVKLNCPHVEGLRPTLTSLLLHLVDQEARSDLHKSYKEVYALDSDTVHQLSEFLRKVNTVRLTSEQMSALVGWIQRGMSGESSTILTPICPDYAHETLGQSLYRFTFDGIGMGVGVTAKRLVSSIDDVHQFFHQIGTRFRHIAAIGDFEAFSSENCKRVGVSQVQFIAHLVESQNALKQATNASLEVPLFTELCGGAENWKKMYGEILAEFRQGNFGETGIDQNWLEAIARARKPLLQRWYGQLTNDLLKETVIRQGAEYATMGAVALEYLGNPLILGVDHAKMAPFYSFKKKTPVLYLTSSYMKDS